MSIPSKAKLKEIADKLASILRIQDWNIKIHIINGFEMNKNYGDCTYMGMSDKNVRLNTANIYLNSDNCNEEWYETLVHELIHVQTCSVEHCANSYFQENHTYFYDLLENMVEKQAQVFCKLYPVSNFDILEGDK
jgi:hypothetical protein